MANLHAIQAINVPNIHKKRRKYIARSFEVYRPITSVLRTTSQKRQFFYLKNSKSKDIFKHIILRISKSHQKF